MSRIVKVRVSGDADDVSWLVALLAGVLPTSDVSDPYNNRDGKIRRYLTVDMDKEASDG